MKGVIFGTTPSPNWMAEKEPTYIYLLVHLSVDSWQRGRVCPVHYEMLLHLLRNSPLQWAFPPKSPRKRAPRLGIISVEKIPLDV